MSEPRAGRPESASTGSDRRTPLVRIAVLGGLAAVLVIAAVGSLLLRDDGVWNAIPLGAAAWVVLNRALREARLFTSHRAGEALPAEAAIPAKAGDRSGSADCCQPDEVRWLLVAVGLSTALGAWQANGSNRFSALGLLWWLVSVACLTFGLAPSLNPGTLVARVQGWLHGPIGPVFRLRLTGPVVLLAGLLLLGALLRLYALDQYPPDMTSDHVEKLLDAEQILQGSRPVFLTGNGGREAVQFYLLALLRASGLPLDFGLLKLLTVVEGLAGLLAAGWMTRVIVGEREPRTSQLSALVAPGLLALSYWHILLSRLGLRIILTPLIVALVLGFYARALRSRRRSDFVLTGLVLGAGLYCYQALRILPLGLALGLIPALFGRRRQPDACRALLAGFLALVVVAAAVFVPLGRYAFDYPSAFWERTRGRMLAPDGVVPGADGTATLAIFADNLRRSLLMFNLAGDVSWFTGSPNAAPELDRLTGVLFLVGAVAWAVRLARTRDPADLLVPLGLLVMLLPAALAIARPIEVPSATRASGAMPAVYLLAAYGSSVLLRPGLAPARPLPVKLASFATAGLVLMFAANANWATYVERAMVGYRGSSLPHQQAGAVLAGFVHSTGAPGNAFLIAYDYWWDHRAVGITAGDSTWPNAVLRAGYRDNLVALIRRNAGTRHELAPDRQLLFFLNQADAEVLSYLQRWLPGGSVLRVPSFSRDRDFVLYFTPPPGCAWVRSAIGPTASASCR